MSDHTSDHAWNSSNSFKEDATTEVEAFSHGAWLITREEVEGGSSSLHGVVSKPVLNLLGLVVGDRDIFSGLNVPQRMRHSVMLSVDGNLVGRSIRLPAGEGSLEYTYGRSHLDL